MRLTLYPNVLHTLRDLAPSTPSSVRHAVNDYKWPNDIWNPSMKTLFLYGASGVGKTSLAMALLPQALKTKHLDLLRTKRYPSNHFGIIYDEGDLSARHAEAQIAFLDREFDTEVHVRYGVAEIPAGHPVIITSNRRPEQCMAIWNPAVARRVTCVRMVSRDTYVLDECAPPTGLRAEETLEEHATRQTAEREKETEFNVFNY